METVNELVILANLKPANNDKIHQRNWIYGINGICPCLVATDYKDPKRIMVEVDDRN